MSGRGRKNKPAMARGGRNRQVERNTSETSLVASKHMRAVGSLIGSNMQLHTVDKAVYDGIFLSQSPNFEIAMGHPLKMMPKDPAIAEPQTEFPSAVLYPSEAIVYLKVCDVVLDHGAGKGFQTDDSISSKAPPGSIKEMKELEPWAGDDLNEELSTLGGDNANGWDPTEMFKRNEENLGVTSTYTPDMAGYTTPLTRKNTKEWSEREARAQKIAQEIQGNTWSSSRAELENGDDEEKSYSAVIRPDQVSQEQSEVYMPPQKRRLQVGGRSGHRGGQSHGAPSGNFQAPISSSSSSALGSSTGPSVPRQGSSGHGPRHGQNLQTSQVHSSLENRVNGESQDVRRSDASLEAAKANASREYSSSRTATSHPAEKQSDLKDHRKKGHKDDQINKLKEFGRSFNLSDSSEPKGSPTSQGLPQPLAEVVPVEPPKVAAKPPKQEEGVEPKPIPTPEAFGSATSPAPPSSLNPLAKVFIPRNTSEAGSDVPDPTPTASPSAPQAAVPPQPQPMHVQHFNYPAGMVPTSYVMPQMQQSRYPKRGLGGHPGARPEYASQIQVANATGTPLLTHGPTLTPSQQMQLQHSMMHQQNPYQYPVNPMMIRYPGTPIMQAPLVSAQGGLFQGEIPQSAQPHGPQQPVYYASMPHAAHPTPGHTPIPPQAPTPQGHNGNNQGPHTMQNQPPTPGPTPPANMMYSAGPGQPAMPQHLTQPNAQSAHNQFIGGAMPSMYVLPQGPLSMGIPPPHSAGGHANSSVSGYTATSSTLVSQFNPPPVHLYQGTPQPPGHGMPGSLGPNNNH